VHRCFTNIFSDIVTEAKMIKVGFGVTGKIVSVRNRGILVQFPKKRRKCLYKT
jgi:ribosomal protein S1